MAAYRRYLAEAPVEVDAVAVARQVAAAAPRRHALSGFRPFGLSPAFAWTVLLAALLAALVGGALLVGSQRKLPAVLPPIGQVYECPPGTDPDEPGPVDQARPPVSPWAIAFDRRAGKVIALAASTKGSQTDNGLQTWTFDVCTNTWTRMHPDREPPGGGLSRLVYDAASDLTIGSTSPRDRTHEPGVCGPTTSRPIPGPSMGSLRRSTRGSTTRSPDSWSAAWQRTCGTTTSRPTRGHRSPRRPAGRAWVAPCTPTTPPSTGSSCTPRASVSPRRGSSISARAPGRGPPLRPRPSRGEGCGGRAHHHVRRGGGADGGRRRFPVGRL